MSDEWDELIEYLTEETNQLTRVITKEANELLKKNVQEEVYDNYSPNIYKRTKDLQKSIKSDKVEGFTYFDDSKLDYKSKVTGENVSMYVPKFLNYGHTDKTGIDNMYHSYPAREFMEKTKIELEEKYGEGCCEIVDNI
ncbi:hypothetical protein [Clostridium brassicae]|uniref:HK97 gp10 family phage protein n=1 Tax=Clostridium brassicae TaxID=2999072 RepID=A0ABT4D7L2_9CLOT|nr:hypothetical protein [Clostridium brassicae]MCY6958284.1 hypothetical protein [Clostridium brassicae]